MKKCLLRRVFLQMVDFRPKPSNKTIRSLLAKLDPTIFQSYRMILDIRVHFDVFFGTQLNKRFAFKNLEDWDSAIDLLVDFSINVASMDDEVVDELLCLPAKILLMYRKMKIAVRLVCPISFAAKYQFGFTIFRAINRYFFILKPPKYIHVMFFQLGVAV